MRMLTLHEPPLALGGQRARLRRPRCMAHVVRAEQQLEKDAEGGGLGRTIHEYVRLPAESYNLLDSKAVQRIDDKSFRVTTGMQRMLLFTAEPTGIIEIDVLPDGVSQRLRDAELRAPAEKPHKAITEINRMLRGFGLTNTITASEGSTGETLLQCQIVLDGTFTEGVFAKVPEERLNSLMGWALGMAMPWFLTKLRQDYSLWSLGKDRWQATGKGEMNELAKQMASGGRGQLPKDVVEMPPVFLDEESRVKMAQMAAVLEKMPRKK